MAKSKEFDRGGDPDVTKTIIKSAPLGFLPILYIVLAFVIILAMVIFWLR